MAWVVFALVHSLFEHLPPEKQLAQRDSASPGEGGVSRDLHVYLQVYLVLVRRGLRQVHLEDLRFWTFVVCGEGEDALLINHVRVLVQGFVLDP